MTIKEEDNIKTFPHSLFFNRYIGKEIHLYLKNRFHYLCKINRIRKIKDDIFVEVYDLKKKVYFLISSNNISKIEEVEK